MKFWARIFAAGFATAALIGAAQFGVVYGLDALRLDRSFAEAGNDWNIQLTWIAWFVLVAVVGGASYSAGQARLMISKVGVGVRLIAAVAAGFGAAVTTLPLTIYPAVNAKLNAPIHAALTVALTVGGALIAGVVLAALIAGNPPLTTNVAAFAVSVWVLAVVSLGDTMPMLARAYLHPVRLGVLDITALQPQTRAYFSMPLLACVFSLGMALIGRARGHGRIVIAVSGAAGPLLIALAYLISGPGLSREVTAHADAYVGAMIAVVVGLLPSAIIAVLPGGAALSGGDRQVNVSA